MLAVFQRAHCSYNFPLKSLSKSPFLLFSTRLFPPSDYRFGSNLGNMKILFVIHFVLFNNMSVSLYYFICRIEYWCRKVDCFGGVYCRFDRLRTFPQMSQSLTVSIVILFRCLTNAFSIWCLHADIQYQKLMRRPKMKN